MQTQKTKQQHTSYLWDGNRQIQQNTATHTHTIIYEQDSFEPIAQFIWLRDGLTAANDEPTAEEMRDSDGWYGNNKPVIKTGVQLYHYHNDHLGTPNELTDQQGDVVWFADYEAYGNTATVEWREQVIDNIKVSKDELQPIRFQGQHFDDETGLHYNRFRYFDPDLGMFTTRDPIGLMGGSNVFQYAPNPTGWIDPFGLSGSNLVRYKPNKVTPTAGSRQGAIDKAWALEKELVETTGGGTRNWSPSEIDTIKNTPIGSKSGQLSSVMSNKGYTGHHINSVKNNGTLGQAWKGDPRNIIFLENHKHPNSSSRPNAYNEHFHSMQGHRGSTGNVSRGALLYNQKKPQ